MGLFYTNSGAVANYAPRTPRPTKPASVKQLQFIGTLARDRDFSAQLGRTGKLGTHGDFIRDEYQGMLYNGTLTTRDASLLIDTLKAMPRKRDEASETGDFFAQPGYRFNGTFTVTEVRVFDDYRLVKAQAADGREFSWFDSSYNGLYSEGVTYEVRATVKAHKVFKGQRSTQLNRVKVV